MRIAIIYPYFAHYRGPIIKKLSEDKENEYVFLGGTKTPKGLKSVKIHNFDEDKNFIRLKNFWISDCFLFQTGLIKVLESNDFDILVFFGDWKYLSYWKAVKHFTKKNTPCLFWSHGVLKNNEGFNNKLKYRFFNIFEKGGFLYSSSAKEVMKSSGYDKELSVIYNSLDYINQKKYLEYKNYKTTEKLFSNEYPYLIFSGRFIPIRKLNLLLESIKELKNKGVYLNLLLVGNGPTEKELKSQVRMLKIDKQVNFYGACYDELLMSKLFKESECCVFPGPIGLTLIHAMTYGVPVVTNDNIEGHKPEIDAFIPNQTGVLFKDNDSNSLSLAIEKVLNLSSEEKSLMKKKSKEIVERKYNPIVQVELMNKRFRELKDDK